MISLASECHCHPSVRHEVINQDILTYSTNLTFMPFRKQLAWQAVYTTILVQLKTISCSTAWSRHIFRKRRGPLYNATKHTYHHKTVENSRPYFPQFIPMWLFPTWLRVHRCKEQISMDSELPLVLKHWLQVWSASALVHLHGLIHLPTFQQCYYARRYIALD